MSRSSKKSKKINKNETEQKSITQSNVKLVVNEKKK